MSDLKIKKLNNIEKICWVKNDIHCTYSSIYDYKTRRNWIDGIKDLVTAEEFYEISQPKKEWYNITDIIELFEKKYNTKNVIVFAISRHHGKITTDRAFDRNDRTYLGSNSVKYSTNNSSNTEILYKSYTRKTLKFIAAINPIAVLNTLDDKTKAKINATLAGKKIYTTLLKDNLTQIKDKINNDLSDYPDYEFYTVLDIDDNDAIILQLNARNLKEEIKNELRAEIKKLVYDKLLKRYLDTFGIKFNFMADDFDICDFIFKIPYDKLINNKMEV